MRVLITGSRTWDDEAAIVMPLFVLQATQDDPSQVTIVHGACPQGADAIADRVAREMGFTVERHPADWASYGRTAGFIRNAEMVELGASLCLAFIRDGSRGASHCARLAEDSMIHTLRLVWAKPDTPAPALARAA